MPLTIGGVTFYDLEVPQEIGPFGGKQVLVVHEYPGGAKDVDSLGAFPHTVSWTGMFSQANAFGRAQQLDRIRTIGEPVLLTFGPQSYIGKVASFEYSPKHQWLIPYKITFEPIADLSGVGTLADLGLSLEALLDDQLAAITDTLHGDDGLDCPDVLAAAASALLTTTSQALLDGGGTVSGISLAGSKLITAASVALQGAAAPLIAGTDPLQASPAADMNARAIAVTCIVAAPFAPVRQLQAVNPNLFQLAVQYLGGDFTRWQEIADASGLPPNPQPIGRFLLQIPAA